MVAPPVAAVDLLYPASHMLRSRRLRLLPPMALHLQTPPLWPSPLHAQLEREYDPGAWLRTVCSSTSSRPRSLVRASHGASTNGDETRRIEREEIVTRSSPGVGGRGVASQQG